MVRNYLKGAIGDHINLLMAACAWNLEQWLLAIFGSFSHGENCKFIRFLDGNYTTGPCVLVGNSFSREVFPEQLLFDTFSGSTNRRELTAILRIEVGITATDIHCQ